MEMLADLKLHEQILKEENIRLQQQSARLDEEIRLLEVFVRRQIQKKKEVLADAMCIASGLTNSVNSNPQ